MQYSPTQACMPFCLLFTDLPLILPAVLRRHRRLRVHGPDRRQRFEEAGGASHVHGRLSSRIPSLRHRYQKQRAWPAIACFGLSWQLAIRKMSKHLFSRAPCPSKPLGILRQNSACKNGHQGRSACRAITLSSSFAFCFCCRCVPFA